ncbi:ABC transporter ATP-binding protein [Halarcobacter anaerophilus]|uniref:ABC transporter ATP-binding protein n=1 Tax=Halarcobacter anaerophilus TaxID=877500 RepID=UPI000697374A|nr:ABC transporter ATP-binding protein [Halarcobacter anaerophilus]
MKKNRALDSLKYYLSKEKRAISILLGISMISSGIAVVQPLLMQKFIDNALILKDIDSFYYFVLLIVFVSILGVALSVFLQYNYTKLSIKVLYSLRLDVFEKIFFNNKLFFKKIVLGICFQDLKGILVNFKDLELILCLLCFLHFWD